MRIPKFWSKARVEGVSPDGQEVAFACWRSSDASVDDAHESALAAAQGILEAFLRGQPPERYPYPRGPLREEVLNELRDAEGSLAAIVTRNQSGALVLNAQRVMFIDIDFPAPTIGAAVGSFFARLFGRSQPPPAVDHQEQARARVAQYAAANPSWNIRLYRTCAGVRGLVTHDLFDPQSSVALDTLRQLGSDPLYIRLCKAQDCFRARLTPKPWRCGQRATPARFPIEDEQRAAEFETWKATYEALQSNYATCRFLGELGSGQVHPEIGPIVELHDLVTKCDAALELA